MSSEDDLWASYCYPETYDPATMRGTLRNLFGERDATVLSLVEYGETADRSRELLRGEANLTRTYDAEQARATHLHLFQDLYDWPGSTAQSTFSRAHPVDLPTSTG